MQMKGASSELFKYNSTWHAVNVIAKTEGIHGLFKGMWPNLLKVNITYIMEPWLLHQCTYHQFEQSSLLVVFLGKTLAVPLSTQM